MKGRLLCDRGSWQSFREARRFLELMEGNFMMHASHELIRRDILLDLALTIENGRLNAGTMKLQCLAVSKAG